jgi:hypothetical protein
MIDFEDDKDEDQDEDLESDDEDGLNVDIEGFGNNFGGGPETTKAVQGTPTRRFHVEPKITIPRCEDPLGYFEHITAHYEPICNGSIEHRILREDKYLATLRHPTTWDSLRDRYGGGFYEIVSYGLKRGAKNKGILTRTKMSLEGDTKATQQYQQSQQQQQQQQMHSQNPLQSSPLLERIVEKSLDRAQAQSQMPPPPVPPPPAAMDWGAIMAGAASILGVLTQKPAPQASSESTLLPLMLDMMNKTNQMQTQMISTTIQQMSENNRQAIERLAEKLSTQNNPQQNPSNANPMEMMFKGMELAEKMAAKSEQKALQIMQMGGAPSEPEEKKDSLIDTLIKSMAPAIPQLIASGALNGLMPKAATPQAQPAPQPALPNPQVQAQARAQAEAQARAQAEAQARARSQAENQAKAKAQAQAKSSPKPQALVPAKAPQAQVPPPPPPKAPTATARGSVIPSTSGRVQFPRKEPVAIPSAAPLDTSPLSQEEMELLAPQFELFLAGLTGGQSALQIAQSIKPSLTIPPAEWVTKYNHHRLLATINSLGFPFAPEQEALVKDMYTHLKAV